MGLDVCFNAAKARAAGLHLEMRPNGNPAEATTEDEGYNDWLRSESQVMKVPGADHWVGVDEHDGHMIVRANKWGDTYAPLTTWLKGHGIAWSEF